MQKLEIGGWRLLLRAGGGRVICYNNWLFEVFPRESGRARCGANQLVCQLGALFGVRDEGVRGSHVRDLPFIRTIDYILRLPLVLNSDYRSTYK